MQKAKRRKGERRQVRSDLASQKRILGSEIRDGKLEMRTVGEREIKNK